MTHNGRESSPQIQALRASSSQICSFILHFNLTLTSSVMSKECPFHKGGVAVAFDQEDIAIGHPAQKLDSIWQKVIENRVFSSPEDWPSVSSLLNEDYSR